VAGDVVTAKAAEPDVTQDLPTADERVTSPVGVPEAPRAAEPASPRRLTAEQEAAAPETGLQVPPGPATAAPATAVPATAVPASGAPAQDGAAPVTEAPAEDDPLDEEDSETIDAVPAEQDHGGRSPVRRKPGARISNGGGKKSAARVAAGRVSRRAAAPADSAGTAEQAGEGGSGAAAMRRRLARLGSPRGGGVNPVLEPLIRTVRNTHPKADIRLIERAYEVAARLHAGQSRRSGDPYITHPLAVATILAELGMPHDTICAALLHDTVEDTQYTIGQLRQDFGEDIAALVDGVTKLDKVKYGDAAQAETVRKMVVAMSRDIRVLVIKLADRLHNMRTLRYLPRAKQEQKSREVLEIFAPLAHRLGMNTVKWELEDLAFATLFPKRYDEIARLVSERAPRREMFLQEVIEDVQEDLKDAKIKATVTGRPKHYYSVYQKMIARNVSFDDIYDLVGIRILVDSLRDCYAVLGTVHARWNPVPGRFKDYIAMPKFNMYQSLHTTVIGPEGKPVELQIRTWGMHKRAEYGVAAHWKYKEEMVGGNGAAGDMAWLRQLVDWQRETEDPAEFLDSLRFDLGGAEVYVFTPRGEVIALPQGATPVDFAYAIHTEVGHRTIGARVNGRLVALESALNNGDTVEIFTSKAPDAGPSQDWLSFVKSARARNKIRHWFSKERREAAAETGKTAIARMMRKQNLPLQRLATADALNAIASDLRYADLSALYAAVGEGHVSAQSVVTKLIKSAGGIAGAQEDLAEATVVTRAPRSAPPAGDSGVVVEGANDVWARLSKCCTPVPGDQITGFVTRGNGVSVHRADCLNLEHLLTSQPERLVNVRWSPREGSQFLVAIQVEALDRTGLLSDVTRSISDQHVNILSATVTTTRDRVAFSRFTFEMGDPKHLGAVLRAVRSIDGVYDVYRVTNLAS
jgi:GTP diphosphokinase / guanosine-3',5'-bis(diphosphate) 3'-diphosphatase